MLSLTPAAGFAAPATLFRPSSEATWPKPSSIPPLQRHMGQPLRHPSSSREHGCSPSRNFRYLVALATSMSAGRSDDPERMALDRTVDSLRKVWEGLPQPVRSFPWSKALANFMRLISELVVAVAKYLTIPVLAVSSLSEMSYCAHERKMALIPFPFLVGFAVAGVLNDTAVEMSRDFKEGEFPWHLLLVAIFFTLLKYPGPYYPYWGRLIIPHFANGGLWRTIWFTFCWYRRHHGASEGKGPENHIE